MSDRDDHNADEARPGPCRDRGEGGSPLIVRRELFPDPPWMLRPDQDELAERFARVSITQDNPHRFRSLSHTEKASALIRGAEELEGSSDQQLREIGWLLREFYEDGHFAHRTLDVHFGFKASGTRSLDFYDRMARRNALLLELAAREPWASMGVWAAARDIRDSFDVYRDRAWMRLCEETPPPATEPRLTHWRILQLGLGNQSMPSKQRIKEMIAEARGEG